MKKNSFLRRVGIAFSKAITNISLSLAIFFMILTIIFILLGGGSLLTAYLILQKHPMITTMAVVLALWLGATLPASIASFLIPEPVVSKVSGAFGLTTDVASALILFIIIAFISAIGAIVSIVLAILFLCITLMFKKSSQKNKSSLIFVAGILCSILFLWFFVMIFLVKSIVPLIIISLIFSFLFLAIGINLLLPYIQELRTKFGHKKV